MNSPQLIPEAHVERLKIILDLSWKILVSQFLNHRHPIELEAPFQHQFASIISSVGNLYCLTRDDVFFVDLEKKCEDIQSKNKYFDIVCSFENAKINCAIELKFKTANQAAQDLGKQDIYYDIKSLEEAINKGYNFGKFYMITDSRVYPSQSKKGVGTIFNTAHGNEIEPGKTYIDEVRPWARQIGPIFQKAHRFDWQELKGWYFLELTI